MLRKAKNTHISSQISQATKALWTASKWAQLVSSAREINPHWPHCTSWWSKISKSRLSWATWTLWPGMEATKSGWQEKIRLLLSPPSLSLTSTDHYVHFWSSSGGIAEVLSWASEAFAFLTHYLDDLVACPSLFCLIKMNSLKGKIIGTCDFHTDQKKRAGS